MSDRALKQSGALVGDRLELVDTVLASEDQELCAREVLSWLAECTGIERALCFLLDDSEKRIEGLTAIGLPVDAARVSVVVDDPSHPLSLALAADEIVEFSDDAPPLDGLLFPGAILAVPLVPPGGDSSPGLLLTGPPSSDGARATLAWAGRLLGTRLKALAYRDLRRRDERLGRDIRWLSGIMEAVTDPILLTDADGRILIANRAAESLFTAGDETSEGRRRAVALNNMLFSAALTTFGDQAGELRRELLLVDPLEGHDLLFELLSSPFETGRGGSSVVSILHNVTDLRRATEQIEDNYRRLRSAEAKTRAERDRLDLILGAVIDPILVTDAGGSIVLMNPPARRLFTVDEGAREPFERRVRANDAVFSSLVSNIHAGSDLEWRGELSLTEPSSGENVPMEAISRRVPSRPGEDTAVVTVLHDLTEAKERAALYERVKRHSEELRDKVLDATAELAEQNELLRRQALELEQASAMKSQFLANVSHELRTPLNAMVGYVSLLEAGVHGDLNEPQRERLERVQANCRHLNSLLNDLLELERIEIGKMPIRIREFAIGEVVDEVMEEVEPLVPSSGPAVVVRVDDGIPPLRSDRKKVKQILINFLSNALKFTDEGEILIRACMLGDDRVAISVADSGIGIAAENRLAIFEAFGQADSSYTRRQSGTGLGLSICKRLASVLGGDIKLESEVGEGSTFTLVLPRILEED